MISIWSYGVLFCNFGISREGLNQASLPRQNDAAPHQGGYQQRPGDPQGQYQQQYRQTPAPAPAPAFDNVPNDDEDLPF